MLEASYKDNETNFLEEIANKLNLKDKTRLVFIERLRIDNDHLNNPALATCLSQSLLKDTSQKATSKIILRDSLKTIFKKLNREGCDFHGVTREKVKIAKQWLREIVYPWHRLKNIAISTNKMGPVPQGLDLYKAGSDYPNTLPLGSQIKFEVRLERPGYLTLLEKDTSGKFYCLSSSFSSIFNPGIISLPMEGAPVNYFQLTSEPGVEEIIAAIAPEPPKLDWLPQLGQVPLLLQGKHLQEFLAYFEGKSDYTLWYMHYRVEAARAR